ncbi:hypothetical protein Glove_494g37 [Diversispora epigaea]|uniref:Uncharacterized protein n=1 Tax=Diversispora epigaea TaxID=1348612 RepID=A0A397GM74_9GLOM|nr:hypothetical protein Glove_494g37 [Diversispora epigaea]
MLSRLFLISTLLLVGITTVAIGAPVAETVEVIKAVKIPQIGSGNLTLNRRFLTGIPGLPQCTNAFCASTANPDLGIECPTSCPPATTCLDFETDPGPEQVDFAATVSFTIYDAFSNPAKAENLKISMADQTFTRYNTNSYSLVLSSKKDQKIEVCLKTVAGVALVAMFSYLEGSYISKG